MGGYIRMDKDLADDPRVLLLAETLIDDRRKKGRLKDDQLELLRPGAVNEIIGGLYRLWRYADTHLEKTDVLRCVMRALSDITRLPLQVLEKFPAEWLVIHGDGTVVLPHYAIKNHLIAKDIRREQGRERAQRSRDKKRAKSNADVTHVTHDEQRDEARYERDESVTLSRATHARAGATRSSTIPIQTSTRTRKAGASKAAPASQQAGRAAPPRPTPEPLPPPPPLYPDSTWVSHSAPPTPRTTTFEQEFKARFDADPDEAHEQRKRNPEEGEK